MDLVPHTVALTDLVDLLGGLLQLGAAVLSLVAVVIARGGGRSGRHRDD
ncbi:hypothetical protein ACIG87_01720 [Micromonospora sp. NPDC051925]